jgi:hypothetical protein
VESCCEFDIEPSGSIKCWETIEWPNISRVVLSSIELVTKAASVLLSNLVTGTVLCSTFTTIVYINAREGLPSPPFQFCAVEVFAR